MLVATTHHRSESENALFVQPRQPDHLATALRRLLNNPGRRADRGERNRQKVKDFAPRLVVPHYLDIMDSTVRG